MYTSDLPAFPTDRDIDYSSYEDLRVARFFCPQICTVKLETHIDMLIAIKLGHLAWDENSIAVKFERDSIREIFL